MAIFKFTSLQETITKIYRDLNLQDTNYELDIVEWCGEALAFIGAGSQFEQVVYEIPITSFKAAIPSGITRIDQVMYKEHEDETPYIINKNNKSFPNQLYQPENEPLKDVSYTLNGNFILCSRETGTFYISATRVQVDEKGYPMVPDNQYYREALFWYCFKHILMRGYKSPSGIDYPYADQNWKFYCQAARNKANYPSLSDYEAFKKSWASLLPNIQRYDEGFDDKNVLRPELPEYDKQQ